MGWVTFTRRTNYPKLGWLIDQLKDAGIGYRLNGYSFHAPILEIQESYEDTAWDILRPVDDVADDDIAYVQHARRHGYPTEAV